jgi:hypothetical protein
MVLGMMVRSCDDFGFFFLVFVEWMDGWMDGIEMGYELRLAAV